MPEMKWIKVMTDIFEHDKLLLLEQHPNRYGLMVAWLKLLCLAGKQNNGGTFLLSGRKPYTVQMLSAILRIEQELVEEALKLFEGYGMISRKKGIITICNWTKYQTLTAYERKLNYDREYRRSQRKARQSAPEPDTGTSVGSFLALVEDEP